MDNRERRRSTAKEADTGIAARSGGEFTLTPLTKTCHDEAARYVAEYVQAQAKLGQLWCLAVASDEPAGKPLACCRKVAVRLELANEDDRDVLAREGLAAMRRARMARLARQARMQGGHLTVEELAWLTCSSTATVKRDLSALRAAGKEVPTRGPGNRGLGLSTETRVAALYLWGYRFTEIQSRTSYSEAAICRCLSDFRHVAALHTCGASVTEIRMTTGLSATLIDAYIRLYERVRRGLSVL